MLRFLLHADAVLVLKRRHLQLLQASARARRRDDFDWTRRGRLVERFADCTVHKPGSVSQSVDPVVLNVRCNRREIEALIVPGLPVERERILRNQNYGYGIF